MSKTNFEIFVDGACGTCSHCPTTMSKLPTKSKPISGISRDAKLLGVCRQHLRSVLSGRRKSDRLLRQYRELKGTA